ncbi:MAG: hypothetical protein EB060_02300 [Proteobacteria bacterium]|nr:hypothetical protein [Pseudomonadota bacterium]
MRCNYTKAFLTSLLLSIYAYACGYVVWAVWFHKTLVPLVGMYRDMATPEWMYGLPLGYLVIGFTYSLAFCVFGKHMCCECKTLRGLKFGAVFFLVCALPGAIFSYALYPVPFDIALAHITQGALIYLGGGVILSRLASASCDRAEGCDMPEMCDAPVPAEKAVVKPAAKKAPAKKAAPKKSTARKKSK